MGLVLNFFLVNRTEDHFLIATLVKRPVSTRSTKGKFALIGPPMGPHLRMMATPELATALHPGVKINPSADGRHGNQLITLIVASVVSCMVLTLLYRE